MCSGMVTLSSSPSILVQAAESGTVSSLQHKAAEPVMGKEGLPTRLATQKPLNSGVAVTAVLTTHQENCLGKRPSP